MDDKKPVPKQKKRYPNKSGNGKNSPVIGMNGFDLQPGDNTKILQLNIELMNMPDIDITDVNAVAKRLTDYFELYARYDMKPTIAGMALALNGHSRQWLYAVVNNAPAGGAGYKPNLRAEVADFIKKVYFSMENQWENYMQAGKINPVTGIFLAKNHYGYRDQTEHVITPNTGDSPEVDVQSIRERYLPETIDSSDSHSDSSSDSPSD